MRYKVVKTIPEPISVVGFGCWAIGGSNSNERGFWGGTSDSESIRAVHRAVDLGINLFDVAPVYGMGHAEEVLGSALTSIRQKVLIASKCGMVWNEKKQVEISLKPDSIRREIEQSLLRLKTDYIDIYQFHWPDPLTPIEQTMEIMDSLIEEGKIRFVGLSNFPLVLARQVVGLGKVVSYQGLYNIFERNADSYYGNPLNYRTEDEIIPFCVDNGLAFFPYSPLFQGLLTDEFKSMDSLDMQDTRNRNPNLSGEKFRTYLEMVIELKNIAIEINRPLSQLAINWLIQKDAVTSVISGAQIVQHVEENAAATEWVLESDVLSRIEEIVDSSLDIQ